MDLFHLRDIGLPMISTAMRPAVAKTVGRSHAAPTKPVAPVRDGRPVVTRFAPSPTGYLHIGGARTALFCYLHSKHHGGKFRLRIEDTDAERNDESAVTAIVQGLSWLGLEFDDEIVRQSRNIKRHQEVAQELLKSGGAYKCYCSKEDLEGMRAEAEKNKMPFRYPGKCRNLGPDFVPPPGVQPVVRIKTPNDAGSTCWDDGVMGRIEVPNKDIDDFVILRPDGSPTYLLAVVCDDHDMEITQVIRGSDHIPNTPRQIAIYKNCGWEQPNFAHLPLIHGPDGKKMSKRHGATGAEQYQALGYLPEAMRNYLAKLSWGHGNDEIFSTEQAIEWFELTACSKGAPCFDFDKLNDLNQHYIKQCDVGRLTDIFLKLYPDVRPFEQKLRTPRIADLLKVRAKTLVEYREAAEFIVAKRPISIIPAVSKNIESDSAKKILRGLADLMRSYHGDWSPEAIEPCIKAFADGQGLKLGDAAKPARAALTGSNASPGIFEVIWAVGKEESTGRFEDAANGLCTIRKPEAPKPAPAETTPPPPKAEVVSAAPTIPTGDLDAQVKAVGDEIRALKAQLKASGLSGKKIDATDEVKALVAKLTLLKEAQACATKAPAPNAPTASPSAPVGSPQPAAGAADDVEAQIKALGDEIRNLKAKLKADGLSGKKIDQTEEVKTLVAKLQELKARVGK